LRAVASILAIASCDEDMCKSIAKFGGVISLHVVARNIRDGIGILQQNQAEKMKEEQMELERNRDILEKVDMSIKNLEAAGFSLANLLEHDIEKEIWEEMQKPVAEAMEEDQDDKLQQEEADNSSEDEDH